MRSRVALPVVTWLRSLGAYSAALLVTLTAVAVPASGRELRGMPLFAAADAEGMVLGAILEYETAQTQRDLGRLERVWEMQATDRSLLRASWRLCEQLLTRARVEDVHISAANATADFEQRIDARCRGAAEQRTQPLRATLANTDGVWRITKIASLAAAEVTRPRGAATASPPALETLSRYRQALGKCDLYALSQEWLMSRGDRRMVESLCRGGAAVRGVSIVQRDVDIQGDSGRIDFVQLIDRGASSPPARASLRASLVRRGDGEWTIWRMRARTD